MNKIILTGRLTKDPEIRYTVDELAIASFTLAVDRKNRKKETDFFAVKCFGKLASFVEEWVGKGKLILVAGRMEQSHFEKNGENLVYWQVIADTVEPQEWKKKEQVIEDSFDDFTF